MPSCFQVQTRRDTCSMGCKLGFRALGFKDYLLGQVQAQSPLMEQLPAGRALEDGLALSAGRRAAGQHLRRQLGNLRKQA